MLIVGDAPFPKALIRREQEDAVFIIKRHDYPEPAMADVPAVSRRDDYAPIHKARKKARNRKGK